MDTAGNLIKDPLLVMRSISVEDACEQLDALPMPLLAARVTGRRLIIQK